MQLLLSRSPAAPSHSPPSAPDTPPPTHLHPHHAHATDARPGSPLHSTPDNSVHELPPHQRHELATPRLPVCAPPVAQTTHASTTQSQTHARPEELRVVKEKWT